MINETAAIADKSYTASAKSSSINASPVISKSESSAPLSMFVPKEIVTRSSGGYVLVYRIGPGFKTLSVSYEQQTSGNFLHSYA